MNSYPTLARTRTLVLALVLFVALGTAGITVLAQGEAPIQTPYSAQSSDPPSMPRPAAGDEIQPVSVGELPSVPDVIWIANDLTFQSNYPRGFQFSARITSSAGPIVRGRIVWSHAPGTQRSRPIEVNPQTGMIIATWDPGPGESTPPWVGITYHWEVGDSAGNSYQSEDHYAEYEDLGHEWTRTESEDIIVFSEGLPDEVNQWTIDAMAEQRETFRQAWGDLLPYKPRAILFGDRDAWFEWQIGANNSRVIGTTRAEWGATVQVVARSGDLEDLAYGTVPHEIAHLYQDAFTIMAAGSWFVEGNATFFELYQMYDYEASARQIAAQGKLPALLTGTGPGVSGQNTWRGYDVGYTFWKWLVDNYGLDGHRQLIQLIKQGIPRDDAIEQVTGLTTAEVESRWRIWLGASPIPPTLIPTPTFAFFTFPTMTPFKFGN